MSTLISSVSSPGAPGFWAPPLPPPVGDCAPGLEPPHATIATITNANELRMREVYTGSCYRREPLKWLASLVIAIAIGGSGCVRVHAYQSGDLAKRAMTNDKDAGQTRFSQHDGRAREGAC